MSFQGQPGRRKGGCTACHASYVERFGMSYRVLDIRHCPDCPRQAQQATRTMQETAA